MDNVTNHRDARTQHSDVDVSLDDARVVLESQRVAAGVLTLGTWRHETRVVARRLQTKQQSVRARYTCDALRTDRSSY